jgi:hypothetical protein
MRYITRLGAPTIELELRLALSELKDALVRPLARDGDAPIRLQDPATRPQESRA